MDGKPLDVTKPAGVVAANNRENLERMVGIIQNNLRNQPTN